MRVVAWIVVLIGLSTAVAQAQNAPGWFTSGPRYERAAKCIAAILYFPQIEESRSELGVLQRAIANDGQMDNDMQIDVRTEGDSSRLRLLDMVLRHVYTATRNFQTQPYGSSVFRIACRKLEAELAR
jgi:hypothetical protein